MPHYIEFTINDTKETLLVEVDAEETAPAPGVKKAGLLKATRAKESRVFKAATSFPEAIENGLDRVARSVGRAVSKLDHVPNEVEVTFGLKATGELGNVAIAKAGAEANVEIRLKWVNPSGTTEAVETSGGS